MSTSTLHVRARLASKPEAEWAASNPILLAGELAISSDKKGMYKTGDGKTAWSGLPYNNSYTVNGHTVLSNVPAGAKFTDTVYAHPNSGASAGTYRSVTVNAQGHVTAGSNPVLPVAQGGTGAATAAGALVNLGISGSYLPLTGGTVTGALTLSRSADAAGTSDNKPALLVGAASTGQHLELDGNEILSKSNAVTPATLYLNTDGGLVTVGSGGLKTTGAVTASAFTGRLNGNASTASALSAQRAFKIGNTSKNFNGSAGLTWTLSEIGAASSGHTHNNIRTVNITGSTVNVNTYLRASGNDGIIIYNCKTSGGAAKITNIPIAGQPFTLKVETLRYASDTDYISKQTFTSATAKAVYERYCTNGTFTAWLPQARYTAAPVSGRVVISDGTSGGLKSSGFTIAKSVPSNAVFTDTTYGTATTGANGLMSAADKKKLDGIAAGAQKNTVTGIKGNAERTYRTGNVNLTPANLGAAAASHTHSYVPLAGGTMTGPLKSSYVTGTHLKGNQGNALVSSTAAKSSYVAFVRYPSTNGIFTLCGYQTGFNLYYTANTTVSAGTNGVTKTASLLNESGNTSLPGALTVAGTIRGSKVYNAVYNDLAEWFPKKDPSEEFGPGDVVVWDRTGVTKCTKEADFSAIGVYSDSYGHILGGEELDDMEENIRRFLPIGLAGRVRVNVTGPVHYGDALVSSSVPGTARADNSANPNAVIGKALEEWEDDGTVHKIQMLIR